MNNWSCILLGIAFSVHGLAQEAEPELIYNTFSTTRVINAHSTETLWRNELDVRITHRFGDIAVKGASHSLYGFDVASDMRFGFEYGLFNNVLIGVGRSKGSGPLNEVWDGFAKWRILQQTTDWSTPISLVLMGATTYTTMRASSDFSSPVSYEKSGQRLSYVTQLIAAVKFGERLSVQLMPTFLWRNFVAYEDDNGLFSIGGAASFKCTKVISVTVEYFQNLPSSRKIMGINYVSPLAVGLEFDTGGHVFHVSFTNAKGIGETQFIPYTASLWEHGEFRLGFTISRIFKL